MQSQKDPIKYILNNLNAIYKAYMEMDKKPKATYVSLKETVIPDIESCIEFKTFNSRIKPIMETLEFLKSDKPIETEKINLEIENLKSDLKDKDTEKVNLIQEIKRLNSVISRLHEDLQNDTVNQNKPIETQGDSIMINEIIQRIEKIEKIVFNQDKPFNEVNLNDKKKVNLNQDKPFNEVNLNDKKKVNLNQDKPFNEVNLNDKNKVNLNQDKPFNEVNLFNEPEKIKIGKWNITRRGNTYRAYRNFGNKGEIRGIQAVYIGKDIESAQEQITKKGFPIN